MLQVRNILQVFVATVILTFLAACTDYVGQVDEQIDEYNAHEDARQESLIKIGDYAVVSTSVFGGTLTDDRDGRTYKTVTIGSLTWMAENLNYQAADSYCFNDVDSNCTTYGRLYTWAAAMDSAGLFSENAKGCGYGKYCAPTYPARGACPDGWHLPTLGEWNSLGTAVSESVGADLGEILRSDNYWDVNNAGSNEYGFSALPAGAKMYSGNYYYKNSSAFFWMSTEESLYNASALRLQTKTDDYSKSVDYSFSFEKYFAFSVRCVKDVADKWPEKPPVETISFTDERDGRTYEAVTIGDQIWMAENLYYDTDSVGYCYEDKTVYCEKYGGLYDWHGAMVACPAGWHLPTIKEFRTLLGAVGGAGLAGRMLKSTSGWRGNGNGLDTYGFSALPGGSMYGGNDNEGSQAYFWSSTKNDASPEDEAYYIVLSYDENMVDEFYGLPERAYSVRCVKD